jgi:hypothetical protein
VFGFIEDHLVTGMIDQIAQEPDLFPKEPRPMDAFVTFKPKARKLILSDVKTRVHSSLPGLRNTRATEIQLSLYHQLLSSMIDGTIDVPRIFVALKLKAAEVLSDGFLVEAGCAFADAGIITFDVLIKNNTLNVRPSQLH